MSNLTSISTDTFEQEVIDAATPVLVDFGAVWCSPCKMLDPLVEQLASEWGGKVKVVKVDVDHNPELAMQYQVLSVPTLILFIGGQPAERQTGFQPKQKLAAKFGPHLN